ncbi:MAG: DUF4129 domain-containing protein [Planctomycetota bacterium]
MSLWLGVSVGARAAEPMESLSPPERVATEDAAATAQLEDVLADPLFSRWKLRQGRAVGGQNKIDTQSLIDRYGERFADRIEAFFDWLFNRNRSSMSPATAQNSGSWFDWLGSIGAWLKTLGIIVLLLTAAFLGWILWQYLRGQRELRARAAPDRQVLTAALDSADALVADHHTWVRHAEELAQEQDHRLAFRAMYLALLSGLHAAGSIRYRRERTNHWYVQGFRGDDTQRAGFAGLTDRFGEVWYGEHVPNADSFAQIQTQVQTLLDYAAATRERHAARAADSASPPQKIAPAGRGTP